MPSTPFANGHEWEAWSAAWCDWCQHEPDCEHVFNAMFNQETPSAWVDNKPGALGWERYTCTDFEEDS